VGAINAAIESFVPAAERAAVAGQLFGEEGSIAMSRIDTATLRQATEDVLAFGVVVSEQDADQIERTNDAISRLGLIWRGLSNQLAVAAAPALEAVANAMAAVASRTGPLGIAIRGLFDNIGRLTTYAATFAAFLAGRWVAGMAAAALSVRGLATALVVLRGALIRTGIGALIVGAGELVYQFTRLVSGAGGFGEAMSLLKDLAVEVWERIRMGAAAAGAAATAMFFDLKADAASGMQSAIESVVGFGNTAANTFEGAYEAIKAIWGLLPAAIGDLAFQAANSLVDGVEAMLNGVVSRINGFIGGINQGLEALGSERRISLVPDLDLGEIENRFEGAATAATTAAQTAFDRAFEDNPLTAPDLGLTEAANTGRSSPPTLYRGAARDLAEGARAPLESWQALRDAVRGTDEAWRRCADRGHRRGRAAGDGARRCRTRRHGCRRGGRGCCRCSGARDRGRRHRLAGGHGSAVGLRQQGPRDRRRHRPEPRRRLPVGRERGGPVREDRQAELPRPRHLAAGRSRPAGGAAVHPRADRQCALRRVWPARAASSPTSCMRAAWSDRPGPRAWSRPWPSPLRRGCMAAAWPGFATTRCPRSCSAASGCCRGARRRATARAAGSTSPSWPATPRASGSRARRSRPTSPAPCRSGGGACDGVSRGPVSRQHQPRRAGRAGAAHPDRRTRLGRRGAQRQLGQLAPPLRCRLRHPPRRRSGGGRRLLRGAQRSAPRLPLQGLGRPQVLPAFGHAIADRPGDRHRRRRDDRLPAGEALRLGRAILDARHRQAGDRATVRIALGGVEQPSGWSVDTTTGVVTFERAPGAGVAITAGFEFDVPVRFDTDALDVTLDLERLGSITSIPLLELRR
jgi:hypothetical protein